MNKLDFAAINLALDPATVVPQWLPDGHKRGNEWVARNPTRNDRNPGSFTINLVDGHWKDFATGDGGSDLVSLYAYIFHQDDQGEAAKELAENNGVAIGDPVVREAAAKAVAGRIDPPKYEPIIPVPFAATTPEFNHFKYGEPTAKWTYRDKDGDILLYICRFDPEGERKQIVPRSWGIDPKDGKQRWHWRGISGKAKRPLYGIDRLAALPDAEVVLVEGEKAADAGAELLAERACVSWMGGVETADRVDVRPLAGRRVILWPDFDCQDYPENHPKAGERMPLHEQPGMRAMMALAQALKGVASEVHMVAYTMDPERHGWDIADAKAEGWSGHQVVEYMAKHTGDPRTIAAGKPPAPPAPPPAAAPPGGDDEPEPPRVGIDSEVNPFGWSHMSDKGQPMNTVENLAYMLDEYGITCKYNIIRKYVEVNIPGRDYGDDLDANCTLAEINSLCSRNRMPKTDSQDYIKLISSQHRYNPVENFIRSKPWDKVERFGALCDTLKTPEGYDRNTLQLLIRRWLISAAAAALMPRGFWSKGVLVLQGAQSEGKTAWIKSLLPPELRGLLKVGATIDPANKDSVSSVISHWLVELGELDGTFRKADIARLKGFISQDIDQLRRPYDRLESEYQRRTVFFASVNPKVFLVDETGNVRWWTIPVTAVDSAHGIDVQQLWAEAAHYFEAGERWWLDRDEEAVLEQTNTDHTEPNPIEELLMARYQWDKPGTRALSASEVLIELRYDKPTNKQAKDAGAILRKLTGGEPKKSNGRQVFMMPPRIAQNDQERFGHWDENRPF
ncbi:hypothetical protein D3C87_475780 [compost metagenome]